METRYLIICMAIMAGVTFLIRVSPLLFFKKKIENNWVQDFFYYIPFCVLAAMTFPSVFTSTIPTGEVASAQHIVAAVVATQVALILSWLNRGLVVVALVAVASAILVEVAWMWF
ncbi:MAG: AzlD domain-containing protein [Bacteroidales bacterium]|nr:AzlD domain-containing protein [Bacteroidales bacterium]